MRCSWLLLVAACAYTDLDQPIGVVAHGLSDSDAANLAEAARCWNLEFGVDYVVSDDVPQQVEVFYDTSTCLTAVAQTQPGTPSSIAVCPQQYWSGILGGPYNGSITPFRVLSHELGHELNIVGHPSAVEAVMLSGTPDFTPMFAPADLAKFAAANPGWTGTSSCKQVIRSFQPFTSGSISHCACDTGIKLDPTAPLTLVAPPDGAIDAAGLAAAGTCWNLRDGRQREVGADNDGQVVYLDDTLHDFTRGVADGNHVLTVTLTDDPMPLIAWALGVSYQPPEGDAIFTPDEDTDFASVYPGTSVHCRDVTRDATTGACTCADPALR